MKADGGTRPTYHQSDKVGAGEQPMPKKGKYKGEGIADMTAWKGVVGQSCGIQAGIDLAWPGDIEEPLQEA
jgi:hypothetical protein